MLDEGGRLFTASNDLNRSHRLDPTSQRTRKRDIHESSVAPHELDHALGGPRRVMQMQPFALELYTWSFAVIVAGTIAFIVGSEITE